MIILIVEGRNGTVHTTLRLLGILVFRTVTNTPSIEYTATTVREWNFPKALTTCSHVILTELCEVLLEGTQSG